MSSRILLHGPPGVGKGTHAKALAAELGVPHVSTGDMLRAEVQSHSAAGRAVATLVSQGALVPDDLVVDLLDARLGAADATHGYVLEGFPRTLPQAQALTQRLHDEGREIDRVVALEAPDDVLMERITARLTCASCGASFHRTARPPRVLDVCDDCGAALIVRDDDTVPRVRARLAEYREKTVPVLAFFQSRAWPVMVVDAQGGAAVVHARVRRAVEA